MRGDYTYEVVSRTVYRWLTSAEGAQREYVCIASSEELAQQIAERMGHESVLEAHAHYYPAAKQELQARQARTQCQHDLQEER